VNVGVAAHISAAAVGGPRYDPNLSQEERSAASNGIWLCQNCAKIVDNDLARFTVTFLKDRKLVAELDAQDKVGKTQSELTAQQAKLALAGKVTLVANRLESFIRNEGASWVSRPPVNRTAVLLRAMGAQLSHFPDEIMVQHYVSEFGEEMKALVPVLRNAGAQSRQQDSYYMHPPVFLFAHALQSMLVELRDAANKLAASADV
jgi:hypothetical protein